ncbi:hypothetical protein TELCIR_17043, partial [Teladorsagia circumcincta]
MPGLEDLPPGKWSMTIAVNPSGDQPEICSISVRVQSSLQVVVGFTIDTTSDYPNVEPRADSATFYNAATYEIRTGCAFSWITQTFTCPKIQSVTNDFMVAHIGEDEFGYLFQRLTHAHCNQADIPSCDNGGVLYNGTCVCTEYWS